MVRALGDIRTLHLDRLDPDDARELARQLLERVSWAGDDMADRIAREASGHPLFIDELARHAMQGGEAGEERARTARLEDALVARVERLEAVQRQVLDAVAVAGGPLRLDVAAHATSIELAGLARAVSRLRVANLVRASGIRRVDLLDAHHHPLRGAVLECLDDDDLRTWHRRIAMAIEAHSPTDVEGLVTHWKGAQDGPKASRYALIAAAHASDAFAFDRAARMYKLALSESPGAEDQRAIRTNLAISLVNAGRGAEAGEEFLAAAEGAELADAIDLRRRAAEQLLMSGHHDEGLAVLQQVLAAMGMEVPRTNRSALASLLVRRGQLRLRGLDYKEKDASTCSEQDLRRIDMLAAVSGSLGMVDTVRGADFQTRHALLALKTGEPHRIVRALSLEAAYCATGGSRAAARTARIVARTRELAARFPDEPVPQGWAISGIAVTSFLEGRWKEAYDLFTEAATILRERCAGQAFALDSANFYMLGSLVHLGEMKELGRRIPALLDEARERGDRYAMTQLRTGVLSIAWLARGDAVGARREADDAISQWSRQGTHLPHFLDVLAQAQIDLYEDQPRAAYARVLRPVGLPLEGVPSARAVHPDQDARAAGALRAGGGRGVGGGEGGAPRGGGALRGGDRGGGDPLGGAAGDAPPRRGVRDAREPRRGGEAPGGGGGRVRGRADGATRRRVPRQARGDRGRGAQGAAPGGGDDVDGGAGDPGRRAARDDDLAVAARWGRCDRPQHGACSLRSGG